MYKLWDIEKRDVVIFSKVQFNELDEAQKTSFPPLKNVGDERTYLI